MNIRWEKLYSGGLGEFYDSERASRRARRARRLRRWSAVVVVAGVAALAVWSAKHWGY